MHHTITRQVFAVVVALFVVCSFVGAPVAAATMGTDSDSGSSSGLNLGSDGDSTDDSTTDDEGDDESGSDDSTDDTESETNGGSDSDDSSDSTTDEETSDDSGDSTLEGDDSTDDSESSEDATDSDEESTDRIEESLNDTVEGATGAVGSGADAVDDASSSALNSTDDTIETTDEVASYVPLEEATGLDVLGFASPVEATGPSSGTHSFEENVMVDPQRPLTEPASTNAGMADASYDTTVPSAESGDEDGGPAPSAPAGAAVGLGAVAAAAAVRESSMLAGAKAASGSGWLSSLLDRVKPFVFPLRYSRYDDSDPLEHEARERVYEIVNETPGSYLSEVSEEADLPLSTTRHHIKVLEREDLVTGAKLHGKRRFYPAYSDGIELAAALNDDSTANIIQAIARIGAASVSDLADELGRDPSTISHHLQRLEDDGVVTREREGRAVVNKLSAEARTALEPETAPKAEASEAVAGGAD